MQNLWSDSDAKAAIAKYAAQGHRRGHGVARLHHAPAGRRAGAGAAWRRQHLGEDQGARHLRRRGRRAVRQGQRLGHGQDRAARPARGAPRADPRLYGLHELSDEDMVNVQRCNLLDSAAPNPSVETLFHAFLPHKFVDHTHANAVLALTDQPDGEALAREVYGARGVVVPYIMPGFGLAKAMKDAFDKNPKVEGLILLKHGIFSMGETAREAYERMIELVTLAEKRLAKAAATSSPAEAAGGARDAGRDRADPAWPLAAGQGRRPRGGARMVLDFRASPAILHFVNGEEMARYSQPGTVTPDHVIRTKAEPLIVPAPEAGKLDAFKGGQGGARHLRRRLSRLFRAQQRAAMPSKKELDPVPRLILVPGLGLFAMGASAKDAAVAADLAETMVEVITAAERLGTFQPFAKPTSSTWNTGRSSRPSSARAPRSRSRGTWPPSPAAARASARRRRPRSPAKAPKWSCSTATLQSEGLRRRLRRDRRGLGARRLRQVAATFGGVDIVVSNAGAAWQGRIGDVDDKVLRQSFELNFWATRPWRRTRCASCAPRGGRLPAVQRLQAGGEPGPGFRPLWPAQGRDAVPDAPIRARPRRRRHPLQRRQRRPHPHGPAHRRDDRQRSKARGAHEDDYMAGNLLSREVKADDVAQAFVSLALAHEDHRRGADGRRRQHRGGTALRNPHPCARLTPTVQDRSMTIKVVPSPAYRRPHDRHRCAQAAHARRGRRRSMPAWTTTPCSCCRARTSPTSSSSPSRQFRRLRGGRQLDRSASRSFAWIPPSPTSRTSTRRARRSRATTSRRMASLGNRLWHSDASFRVVPAKYSILSGRIVATEGGNTEFADMRAAYDALDAATKAEVEDLVCEHSLICSRGQIGFTEFLPDERGQ